MEKLMKAHSRSNPLLSTASVLALTAMATITMSPTQPAEAAETILGGGSTLLSLSGRQVFDCYRGSVILGDGYVIGTPFPEPGKLPPTCTVGAAPAITSLYAGVGSGSGQRAFITNNPHLLLQSPATGTVTTLSYFPLPAAVPKYFGLLGTYPYPELDFAANDAPLPNVPANSLTTVSYNTNLFVPSTNWQTLPSTASITIPSTATSVATYSTAKFGEPIQIPAAEVPLAIAVNTATTTAAVWDIRSRIGGTGAGSAIQLTAPQLCAIFSGQVTEWGDTTTKITWLNNSGVQASELFDAANTSKNTGAGASYLSSGKLPIQVVYRSDGSGTSYIMTNFLAAVCPLFNTPTNKYKEIFTGAGLTGGKPLPNTSFSNLVNNIKEAAVPGSSTANWIGTSGSGNVALAVNGDSANAGRIGYVSADFTKPYTTTTSAPLSASIQDEHLRANGIYHPGVGTGQTTFIAPTPANASLDWTHITAPNTTTATFNNWNVYDQTFTSGVSGGVNLAGKNVLPFEMSQDAYPLTGTTFLEFYSCYSDTAGTPRVTAITSYLAWYLGGSNSSYPHGTPSTITRTVKAYDPDVGDVLRNNGFNTLPASFAGALYAQYVLPSADHGSTQAIAAYKTSGAQVDGCKGVTGGGAK